MARSGRPSRATASSPRLAPKPPEISQAAEDVSVRSMRLKVLYTFDDENKTNCLARWPHNIDIRTAYLDENTQIGVIELKTCIQAIVTASPELVAKLGHDYTVYAYDYSEYETPLVGQGMLSWVLASSSSTPSAPAHQSRTIVTGRVCKNIMGLFSSSSQETLEVKLRLVPVPTCLQSEYIESMKSYRELSRVMPEGFNAQAWTSFIQENPGILQLASQSRSQSPSVGTVQRTPTGIEQVQRLHSNVYQSGNQNEHNHLSQSDNYSVSESVGQMPRPASQASSVRSSAAPRRRGRPPKTSLGDSTRNQSAQRVAQQRRGSIDAGYASHEDQSEGPSKKRAKVTKVDYTGASDFVKQPDSLRVAASTAASLRIHQPTAIRPSVPTTNTLDGPPREPTPIAGAPKQKVNPDLQPVRSRLRQQSLFMDEAPYESPYAPSEDNRKLPPSEITSPEGSRAESANTPVDISSSPPAFPSASTAASSPRLPTLSREIDSGFMSGAIDDLFEDSELQPFRHGDLDTTSQCMKQADEPNVQPSKILNGSFLDPDPPNELQYSSQHQEQDASNSKITSNAFESRPFSRTMSSGAIAPRPVDECNTLRPSTLNRSQTWSGRQADLPSSDALPSSDGVHPTSKIRSRNRTGSGAGAGARRKKAIQSKLEASIAAGEMPPFCENCGSVETPTWRKAWIKVHSGSPEHVVISEEEGGIVAWQSLQKDDNGTVVLYRIIKRSLLPTDEGFKESLLCNPCGLWLHTRKCMRPEEAWDKNNRGPDGRGGPRKRTSRSQKQQPTYSMSHSATDASGGSAIYSDASSPAEDKHQAQQDQEEPQLPAVSRPRASSNPTSPNKVQMDDTMAAVALERAIQSSPVRFGCHPPMIPQAKDLTPKPTRRILFPSPTQSDHARTALKDEDINAESGHRSYQSGLSKQGSGDLDPNNKENHPPPETEDDFIELFADNKSIRSTTPTPYSKVPGQTFKTPKRDLNAAKVLPTTGDFFSSAAKALLRPPTTPKRTPTKASSQPLQEMTPFTAQLNQLLSDANNGSPGGDHFDLPGFPSLSNTPNRMRNEFDFTQFDPQDILSTDVPMPSSPPAWFGVYEDPEEWNGYQLHDSSPAGLKGSPKLPGLTVDKNGLARVDFSDAGLTGA
ncbi:MAG: hypothetical protein Q9214_001477 [Letrouitia sp. 1 TL-2023]